MVIDLGHILCTGEGYFILAGNPVQADVSLYLRNAITVVRQLGIHMQKRLDHYLII